MRRRRANTRVVPSPGRGQKDDARSYVVIDVTDVRNLDFGEFGEDSSQTLRRSNDGTLVIVKWVTRDGVPFSLPAGAISHLTAAEARALMRTPEWSDGA